MGVFFLMIKEWKSRACHHQSHSGVISPGRWGSQNYPLWWGSRSYLFIFQLQGLYDLRSTHKGRELRPGFRGRSGAGTPPTSPACSVSKTVKAEARSWGLHRELMGQWEHHHHPSPERRPSRSIWCQSRHCTPALCREPEASRGWQEKSIHSVSWDKSLQLLKSVLFSINGKDNSYL